MKRLRLHLDFVFTTTNENITDNRAVRKPTTQIQAESQLIKNQYKSSVISVRA